MPVPSEAYLINSILNAKDLPTALATGLSPEIFHTYIDEWEWIERYYKKFGRTPSKTAFLKHFPEFVGRKVDDTAHFTEMVKKDHTQHLLMEAMRDATDLITQGDLDTAVGLFRKTAMQAASSIGSVRDSDIFENYRDIYDEVRTRKDAFDESGMAGIPTGFETIDERTGGVKPGQSWIVGARLGEGKSWTLLKMACAAVIAGHNVQFDALEMSRAEVGMRVHNFMSSSVGQEIFMSQALAQGKDFDIKLYRQFLRDLKSTVKGKLHVSDDSKIGALEIASQIERNKPDILFLDYLTLAKTGGDGGWQDIGKFSKELKQIAKEYGIGVVSAAQLNRANGLGRDVPGAEALGISDSIGQDADVVINMKRRTQHIIEFLMAKDRHGSSGYKWWVHQDLMLGKMSEVSFNKAQDLMEADRDAIAEEQEAS